MHTVIAADAAGQPLRVSCGYCRSEHNYRGGPRTEPVSIARGVTRVVRGAGDAGSRAWRDP